MTKEKKVENKIQNKVEDLEIKDANLIFTRVWNDLKSEYQLEELIFPHEIIWLGGAPGSGKGTNTPFIMKNRGISAPPIVTSDLLNSPSAKAIKNAGALVGDKEVVGILLREILKPKYASGVIVDGFPRTKVQVECLKMFFRKLTVLHNKFEGSEHADHFRRPIFRIVLLFVGEEESVSRQLKRGSEILKNNEEVKESGRGNLMDLRITDTNEDAARNRYKVFKTTTFDALHSLQEIFHFYFIDAKGSLEEVEKNIAKEFKYQSTLELAQKTFEQIRSVPLASEMVRYARQDLIKRLDNYAENDAKLFETVVQKIHRKFLPIIERYTCTGMTLVNSEDSMFHNPTALTMLIDIFSERGFHTTVDVNLIDVPAGFDPKTFQIKCKQKRVYRFHITFKSLEIRRGH